MNTLAGPQSYDVCSLFNAQHSEGACSTLNEGVCSTQWNGMMSLCGDEFVVFVQHHALNIVNIHNVSDVVCLLEDGSRKC